MNKEKLQQIRNDFPILSERVYGKPLVYFDNAATTQKPRCVVERIDYDYYHLNANIHRGVHFLSQKATEAHENARSIVAGFLHAEKSEEIIFTRGTTEAINLVASSFGEAFCKAGDEIVISTMEHHSNIVPWQMVCERKGLKLRVIPISDKGELDMEALELMLNEKTRLVSVAHVSNVLGTINPIEEIIRLAHERDIPVLIDGAQAVPHLSIDVVALNADFYVFSSHKVYGPTGIGVLYGKEKWLNAMPPYQGGGEMIAKVTFEKTTYNDIPFKFEAGTPDYVGSTALAEAIGYIKNIGLQNIAQHENELSQYATQELLKINGLKIIGTSSKKCSVVSFIIDNIHPYDIGMLLDKQGIAVRTGHHCAQPLMDRYEIPGTIRASFALYNTIEEIDMSIIALKKAVTMLS